jgi:chromosome segregation ATPase
MQFTKDQLAPENYSGTRRITVSDSMITKYKAEIDKYQKQAQPTLIEMENISKVLDPDYAEIKELNDKIKVIKDRMQPTLDAYQLELAKVELIDKKAQAIKNKLQPIVDKLIDGKLEEFERPLELITEKGQHYVLITDTIEDFIKARRAGKK